MSNNDFAASNPVNAQRFVETYKGYSIFICEEDGYYSRNLGYCDSIEEIHEEIDGEIFEQVEHNRYVGLTR